jgi:CRP-like cAMP-binding protein
LRAQADPELRSACVRALAALPREAVDPIVATLDDSSWPRSERCAMARVLGGIGGLDAARALWAHALRKHDPALRLAAAEGLRTMRVKGTLSDPGFAGYEALVTEICDAIVLMRRAAREVGAGDPFAHVIFEDCGRLHIELLCALLALRHDVRTVDRIRHNLSVQSREMNVLALELFEEVLPLRLATTVTGALQTWFDADDTAEPGLGPETKARLLHDDPWLRVVTVRHVNQGAAYPTLDAADFTDQDRELYRLLDLVSFLKQVPLLREISAYYLLEQAEIAEWQVLSAGQALFRQGAQGDALYIVGQGTLEVRIGATAIAKLGPGECIGELALLDGEPRSADALALEDCTLLRVPGSRFKTLLVTQPPAAQALLRTLDRRIRDVQVGATAEPAAGPRMRRSQLMRAQKLALPQLVSTMSFLREVGLFKDLSTAALANLAGIAQEVLVYEGDTLFEQGDEGESLYLVCSGRIAISVDDRQVAALGRNACLGEMALVSGLPRSATARALEEGRLLRIGSDDFTNLLATEPEITLALLRTLSERLRAALKRRTQPN